MKKIFVLFAAAMMAVTVSAQHEIGGIVGGLNGLSYKYWFSNSLAIQADLAVGLTEGVGAQYYQGNNLSGTMNARLYDFTINPNVLYHFNLPANFKIYVGGGINFGLVDMLAIHNGGYYWPVQSDVNGKFGANAAVGLTYDIQAVPLVLAFDFRPGYGLGFQKADNAHISYFDWKLAFAVRYRL